MPDYANILPETETTEPIVRGPGQGRAVGILGDVTLFKVENHETGGAYAVLEQTIPAGHGPPLHVHRHETEIFYIVSGQFEVTIGDHTISAPPGTLAVGPRDIPHTFRNVGPDEGKLLLTVIPGRFSEYFVEADHVADGDHAAIKRLCAKYDVEILAQRPPLPRIAPRQLYGPADRSEADWAGQGTHTPGRNPAAT